MDAGAYFAQQLFNGLSLGVIYALIALGYTMVYGVLRFINFAHGDVFMVGAYLALKINVGSAPYLAGLPPYARAAVVLLATMAACAALGMVIEQLAYRPLRSRPRLIVLITAIGVSLLLEYSAQAIFGATPLNVPAIIPVHNLTTAPVVINNVHVLIFLATGALLLALRHLVQRTRTGLAMRALSLNPTAAALMGVNNNVVIAWTFGIGSALAGAAAIFFIMLYPKLDPFMGVNVGIKAFVAAVLGGIGNLTGAALGGILIGVVEALVSAYGPAIGVPSGYKEAVAFVVLIAILLFRPAGLLGKVEREKV